MGLDSVEIIVDIENCFGITIDDLDAERIRTVGELCDHVWSLVDGTNSDKCYNQIIFFRVRKFVLNNSSIAHKEFNPKLKISEIWNKQERKEIWHNLALDLNINIPKVSNWILAKPNEIFPSDTIQDMIDKLVIDNISTLKKEFGLNKMNVDSIVISILRDKSGLERNKIQPDARIASDLGID